MTHEAPENRDLDLIICDQHFLLAQLSLVLYGMNCVICRSFAIGIKTSKLSLVHSNFGKLILPSCSSLAYRAEIEVRAAWDGKTNVTRCAQAGNRWGFQSSRF